MMTWYEDVLDLFHHYLPFKRIYYNTKRILHNVRLFIPLIRDYMWYDYTSILLALSIVMKDMSNNHKTRGMSTRSDMTAKNMKIIELLSKRLREDDYEGKSKLLQQIEVKHEFIPIPDKIKWTQLKTTIVNSDISEEQYNKKLTQAFKKEELLKKHDLYLLTKLLNKHLFTFWD
jgi:hypothetical protein